VAAGMAFERIMRPARPLFSGVAAADPSALAMLFCWAAWWMFPFFPVMWLGEWRHKLSIFIHGPALSAIPLLSAAASWFAVALMIRAARIRSPGRWLAWSVLLIPAQFAIVTRQPLPVDLLGALAGIALFFLLGRFAAATPVAALAFLALVIIRGLAPFQLSAEGQAFTWIPFGAYLGNEWQSGIRGLLEKLFHYGAAVWLLRRAGLQWWQAAGTVCAVLTGIEIVQIHIPGRTPEITDPLLGALAGAGLKVLERPAGKAPFPQTRIGYDASS